MDKGGDMIQAKAVENLYRALIRRLEVGVCCLIRFMVAFSELLHISCTLSASEHRASTVYRGGEADWR